MRASIVLMGLVLALQAPIAAACGHCVEDKIASVYDHALVTQALASQQQVAFFSIDGDVPANEASRKGIESIAETARGVAKKSVKVSIDTAALSFVFDPKVQDIATLQKIIEKKLADKKLSLQLIKVMAAREGTHFTRR